MMEVVMMMADTAIIIGLRGSVLNATCVMSLCRRYAGRQKTGGRQNAEGDAQHTVDDLRAKSGENEEKEIG
jgi:hypothetical protein